MKQNKKIITTFFLLIVLSFALMSSLFLRPKNAFSKTLIVKHDEGGAEGAKTMEEIEKEKEEQERKEAEEFWELDYPWKPPKPNLPDYIKYIYEFAFWIGAFIAIVMIVVGGIQWTGSSSNPQIKADAKKRITNAIIGLIALFAILIVLRAINPDILILRDIEVEEATSSRQNQEDQAPPQETEEANAIKKGQFYYPVNGTDIGYEIARNADGLSIDGTKDHFAKFTGHEYTQEDYKAHPFFWEGIQTVDICFYGCKYYHAGSPKISSNEELKNLSPNIYGVITKDGKCKCYKTIKEENTTPAVGVFKVKDACECAGEAEPLCFSENHEFCMDYCKRGLSFTYKFGYIAKCNAGAGKDDIICACSH